MKECKTRNVAKESLHVNDFVNDRILNSVHQGEKASWDDCVSSLNWYFELSDAFHKPKGEGYKLVLNCLHKYLDFKFIRENNCFRFQEGLFDERIEVVPGSEKYSYNYRVSDQVMNNFIDGSKADIYYLLHEADQEGIASRRCINYVNSNRLHLTAVLIQLIERIVDNLERNPLKKYQEYGRVLRAAYMTPENAELDVFSIFEVLGMKKKKYYRIRNAAISLVSETLFGVLAGENGFAELYVEEEKIRVANRI